MTASSARLQAVEALVGRVTRLARRHLNACNAQWRAIGERYRDGLPRGLASPDDPTAVHHLFPVRIADRNAAAAALTEEGTASGVHYPVALPDQPALRDSQPAAEVDRVIAVAARCERWSALMNRDEVTDTGHALITTAVTTNARRVWEIPRGLARLTSIAVTGLSYRGPNPLRVLVKDQ